MIGFNDQAVTIEYPGAIYHALSRGDWREASFRLTLTGSFRN